MASIGETQWVHFISHLTALDKEFSGPVLDLGSGQGDCVLWGLQQGHDVWGIETDDTRFEQWNELLQDNGAQNEWSTRCLFYDGEHMPFENEYFSAVVSWYVLEHIPNLAEVLRETARVLKSGGLIYFKAQDARISYEGHCDVPWLPFMPRRFLRPWLEEFDKLDKLRYLENYVFDFTMDEVASILECFGCEIIEVSSKPETLIKNHWQYHTEPEIRQLARKLKDDYEQGDYPEHQFPFIKARKL
jgi:ubiquinone/menaquinone biosynthesis C-methylase UbiE